MCHMSCVIDIFFIIQKKYCENCKTLTWHDLIGCQCVQLFSHNYLTITTVITVPVTTVTITTVTITTVTITTVTITTVTTVTITTVTIIIVTINTVTCFRKITLSSQVFQHCLFADSLDELFLIDTRDGPLSLRHVVLNCFFSSSRFKADLIQFHSFYYLKLGKKNTCY